MEDYENEKSGILKSVARVMNAGGNAAVYAFDATSQAMGKFFSVAKKAVVVPRKAKGLFVSGLGLIRSDEIKRIEAKIKDYEQRIKSLYFLIGKEGAQYSTSDAPLEAEAVKKLIAEVRTYEREIERLEARIAEVQQQHQAEVQAKRERVKKPVKPPEKPSFERVGKLVKGAIDQALKNGEFETTSERAIFEKVAKDLLDDEMEIKVLAAAELGRMGHAVTGPVLVAAAGFEDSGLLSEIINSLITLGDPAAIPLFREHFTHAKHRIRIGCLRGLYKMADDQTAAPILIGALRDEHPEVRKTAVTFLGWKNYPDAVPSLIQCLRDDEGKVRKATVQALANLKDEAAVMPLISVLGDQSVEIREQALEAIQVITGEEVAFDISLMGQELNQAIGTLRDWWQQIRLGRKTAAAMEEPDTEESDLELHAAEERPIERARPTTEDSASFQVEPKILEPGAQAHTVRPQNETEDRSLTPESPLSDQPPDTANGEIRHDRD
ncbi:MAG: HEAT repeat domain-containing protein [Deltaproteobacteria bacterium]|nr:HEAT repeat domain-containing protein [Deltaproteobacteria bacterium]